MFYRIEHSGFVDKHGTARHGTAPRVPPIAFMRKARAMLPCMFCSSPRLARLTLR